MCISHPRLVNLSQWSVQRASSAAFLMRAFLEFVYSETEVINIKLQEGSWFPAPANFLPTGLAVAFGMLPRTPGIEYYFICGEHKHIYQHDVAIGRHDGRLALGMRAEMSSAISRSIW